jgi:hypothetical protein
MTAKMLRGPREEGNREGREEMAQRSREKRAEISGLGWWMGDRAEKRGLWEERADMKWLMAERGGGKAERAD